MQILYAASEAHPLIKTGGLGDVVGSLPKALQELGHDVRLILPAYREAVRRAGPVSPIAVLHLAGSSEPARLLLARLPGSQLPVYLVEAPCFDRDGGPYGENGAGDWPDNAGRFGLFCRAIVEVAQDRAGLGWQPQLVHAHDWQSALAPALLTLEAPRPATVFTIHNLAYQGLFDQADFQRLLLPAAWWSPQALEFYDRFSFIKAGLVFSDRITTVSPNYAREILTPEFGCGLEGVLQMRAHELTGILNGADYDHWNPAHDPHITRAYSADDPAGKPNNKRALQRRFGLPQRSRTPLFAHIGRLVEQKGADLVLATLPRLIEHGAQLVVLGTGETALEDALRQAAAAHPQQVGVMVGYDEALAHRIEAGADAFLMPSRFEPCGLNQIYSLRYGTVPVVRRTGGLADTVREDGATSTGFLFDAPSADDLWAATARALAAYADRPRWAALSHNGMTQDFGWSQSAAHYAGLYQELLG
jgi:starch synthase